ncbi:hypothetical protein A3J20_06275 [Candidatus Gottesmanbacteria bacterium RIFCSPLOWO2_02_FULL_42_29]|nr:MAG: hypothetical protein A2781_05480 [Candidatus Gottesmanbacteria bacterium RIFCSPHIGHO2_01_FULL_42_27]OGG21262.1 MAG: hypothetical protein A3E72_05010 [Candidatus Gottesmanbacteria bacterium RIFCSPHIGHO2_12_FULL_43_26]OGG33669.1 MAG: hypothetical protein A3G68_02555 [Candidatus Gottesmanbacteria bacterium RIFCSPLOWO2_12_FULL_42_10]OGG36249.1 MAG: hypothetical protein A2968_04305 [Candidatus Gottesmanbacteria bacterium RIFCSPLOWO2_01_FULL_42_22]OGG39061.1 MAG: hypothetical protein A3J20_06
MGLNVIPLNKNHEVSPYLAQHPEISTVVLRQGTYHPEQSQGTTIAPQLIEKQGFEETIIILTGNLYPEMLKQIPEKYRQQIHIWDSSTETYAALLDIALRSRYPEEMRGIGRSDFLSLLGFPVQESTQLVPEERLDDLKENTFSFVNDIFENNGSDEAYAGLLEKIRVWKSDKEGGQIQNKEK